MDFIAFDLETTGTVPSVDKIVEIGAIKFRNNEVDSMYVTFVDPLRPIPPGASAVNGISDDMVKGKPTIDVLLDSFAEFCEDLPMVAHNAPFDSQFLIHEIKRHETKAPKGVILDTLQTSRKVFPGLPNYKLGTLIQHLKIPASGFHRAEADAHYCGLLFMHMGKKISLNGAAPQLSQWISLSGKLETRFPQLIRQPKQLNMLGL